MNILRRIEIEGFWEDKSLELELHPDINFLIGVNGSGKTTVINMISAALNMDFQALDRLSFRRLTIHLAEVSGRRRPSIEIQKKKRRRVPFSNIVYRIKSMATADAKEYSLEEYAEQLALRDLPHRYYQRMLPVSTANLNAQLKKLVNSSWLSIHRSDNPRYRREERTYESTVDEKLSELSNSLVRYSSLLARQAAREMQRFQKIVFLSLVERQDLEQVFAAVSKLSLEDEKEALAEIFGEFQVRERESRSKLKTYFDLLDLATRRFNTGHEELEPADILSLLGAWRVHSVVQQWKDLRRKHDEIYQPRQSFLLTLNGLVKKKCFEINDKNELIAIGGKGQLPLAALSSGEKQLVIILGEALLQAKSPWVYIADEPELSLHVEWQEQLVSNLRKLNPGAQILFATHSPDIISSYSDRVFNMEEILA